MSILFFFNDTATTEIYTLSLHDALPISFPAARRQTLSAPPYTGVFPIAPTTFRDNGDLDLESQKRSIDYMIDAGVNGDRKSTRLNSSHANISYAVFCLKKKNKHNKAQPQ